MFSDPEIPVKGPGVIFSILVIVIDVTCASFQFYSMLALKLGFRKNLRRKIDQCTSKIKETVGRKAN
jgi:hypothetical protein